MPVMVNGVYADKFLNGVAIKETLNPANETVNRGRYAATTLSAVDSDLAVGNIKEAVTIFGKLGTFAGGAPAEDVLTTSQHARSTSGAAGEKVWGGSLDNGQDETLDTITETFDASAWLICAFIGGMGTSRTTAMKVRLYVAGIQRQESGYINEYTVGYTQWQYTYSAAHSGSITAYSQVHCYHALTTAWQGMMSLALIGVKSA